MGSSGEEAEAASDEYDVIVVGAGIMGSCVAYEVARRGRSVLLLEQFDFLHHRGSSHGESRTIRATYPEPCYTAMVLESSRLWEAAQAHAGYRVLTRTPHLDVGPADDRSLQLAISSSLTHSVPVKVLSPSELSASFSGAFSVPEGWVGVLTELGGVIKPTKAVSMFQSLAAREGAVLRDRTEVVGIEREEGSRGSGGVRVTTAGGGRTFRGRKCVVAAGAWMRKLVKAVSGDSLPIQPLHTTICYWRIAPGYEAELTTEGGFPTFASYGDPYIYGTPSMEFPGLIKIALHGGYECDPDRRDWETDMDLVQRSVRPWVEQVMGRHVVGERPVITQSCMYSITPDGDFVIDYLGGEFGEDVVVAGGFSGHGFKMGPAVGRMVADMVLAEGDADAELSQYFRVGRFEGNPGGNAKKYESPTATHSHVG